MHQRDDWQLETQVPRQLKSELSRPQLLERLVIDADARLVALIAPSGYGKTTLLAQYARVAQWPVAWLTVVPEMANPLTLADALAFSVARVLPGVQLTRFQQARADATRSEVIARALARDLALVDVNIRMVFDQAQHLSVSSADWLDAFVQHLPEGHQVLLSCYDTTHLRMTRLSAQAQVLILGAHDLAFSEDEARLYLQVRGVSEHADHLVTLLEGWPAGLALTSAHTSLYVSPAQMIQESLSTLPPEVRVSLAEAAVASVWSEARLRELGVLLPYGWLDLLIQHGLPLTPLGQGLYRPHQLILGELQRELSFQPERSAVLYRSAGKLEEAAGNLVAALSAYRRGKSTQEEQRLLHWLLTDLSRRNEYSFALQLLEESDWNTLTPAIQGLNALILSRLGRSQEAEPMYKHLQALGTADVPEVTFALGDAAVRGGRYEDALMAVNEGLRYSEGYWTLRFHLLHIFILSSSGSVVQALEAAHKALQDPESYHLNDLDHASLYKSAAHAALQAGEFNLVRSWSSEAIKLYQKAEARRATLSPAWELAYVYGLTGETELGLSLCEEVLAEAQGIISMDVLLVLEMQANLHFWARNFDAAQTLYEQLRQHALKIQDSYLTMRLTGKLAETLFRRGCADEAKELMLSFQNVSDFEFRPFFLGFEAFVQGKDQEAIRFFKETLQIDRSLVNQFRAKVFLAELEVRRGPLGRAITDAISDEINRFGSLHLFHLDADYVPHFLAMVDERGLGIGTPGTISTKLVQLAESAENSLTLNLKLLGSAVELTLAGQSIKIPHVRARELLLFLVIQGQSNRDELVNALWDGDSDSRNVEYFKVVVRRLRAMLMAGPPLWFNPLPFEQGHYSLAKELNIQTDVSELKEALRTHNLKVVRELMQDASSRGMATLESEWGRSQATALGDLMIEALQLLYQDDPSSEVKRWAQERLVEIDAMDQDAHLRLIQLLKQTDDCPSARIAYKKYVRIMESEYGVEGIVQYDEIV